VQNKKGRIKKIKLKKPRCYLQYLDGTLAKHFSGPEFFNIPEAVKKRFCQKLGKNHKIYQSFKPV
jgi:hypothetical protein